MNRELTIKQKKFCEFYVASGNATEAGINAGYSKSYSEKSIYKLLENENIKKYIDELIEETQSKRVAKAQEIMEYLTAAMRGSIEEEVVVVEMEGDGFSRAKIIKKEISIKDRTRAAELLGKRYAMFTDKQLLEDITPVMIVGEDELED